MIEPDLEGLDPSGYWLVDVRYDKVNGHNVTLAATSEAEVFCLRCTFDLVSHSCDVVPAENHFPVADLGRPYSGEEDVEITFDGSGSFDPDGDPLTYTWDFGDGTAATGPSATITHAYSWGGSFLVDLTVSDARGRTASQSTDATVSEVNDLPVADANGRYNGLVGDFYQFRRFRIL